MSEAVFDYKSFLTETVDDVAERLNCDTDPIEVAPPMSTHMLSFDLIYGGGIRTGWYTHFGKEQSSKTTSALAIAGAAINAGVPLISFWDFENSSVSSIPYIRSVFKTTGVKKSIEEIFGKKDANGKWEKSPIVRFRAESIGEKFFSFLSTILKALPDKKMVQGKWWLVYEDTKQNHAKLAEFADPKMPKRYGSGLWIPAENGEIQALFIVDSYPAMNTISNDGEEEDKSIASQARMFSDGLKKVMGRLASKMVAVIGVNQLRDSPMAMYGPKEIEPCGNALKFSSSVRTKFTPRVSGQPLWPKDFDKETGFELEPSTEIEGGFDSYRYIQIKTVKNKLSAPNRSSWLRIWVSDATGSARGYDPVFDTLYFLFVTGQLAGRGRKSIKLKLYGSDNEVSTTWYDLKRWILGDSNSDREFCEKFGYKKVFNLRSFCFALMRREIGEKLYVKHQQQQKSGASTGEE